MQYFITEWTTNQQGINASNIDKYHNLLIMASTYNAETCDTSHLGNLIETNLFKTSKQCNHIFNQLLIHQKEYLQFVLYITSIVSLYTNTSALSNGELESIY